MKKWENISFAAVVICLIGMLWGYFADDTNQIIVNGVLVIVNAMFFKK